MGKSFDDGLLYSFRHKNGGVGFGWVCRADCPSYSDLDPWLDALESIKSALADMEDSVELHSILRCSHKDAMRIVDSVKG